MREKTKLDEKHEEQSRLRRGRRTFERWSATPEGKRALAVTAAFRSKWQQELAELEAAKAAHEAEF